MFSFCQAALFIEFDVSGRCWITRSVSALFMLMSPKVAVLTSAFLYAPLALFCPNHNQCNLAIYD